MIPSSQSLKLPEYARLLKAAVFTDWGKGEAIKVARSILGCQGRYEAVSRLTGVPWEWIAAIHYMECNGDFTQHLANGDPISALTINQPRGIPAGTWEECAIAALNLKGYQKYGGIDWRDENKWLWRAEEYNGWGYANNQCNSPYLWSGTNHYQRGKYVSDGIFDPEAVSEQVGVVVIWAAIKNLEKYGMTQSIDLIDVCKYYKDTAEQSTAVQWLESRIDPKDLADFADMWRQKPVTTIPQFTDPFAAEQYQLLSKYAESGAATLTVKTNYYSQRDNYTMPYRTCNSTTSAMYLDWLMRATGKPGLGGDDKYLATLLSIGDTIYHENQTAAIDQYGFKTKWLSPKNEPTEEDFNQVDILLDNGFPVPVNISHRGTDDAPTGGHVILLIARRKSEGTYISHDPYGTLSSGYSDTNGRFNPISRASFRARWQGGRRVVA